MTADGTEFEFPDEAGYPDGMGTLHEGTDDEASTAAEEVAHFGSEDEEDVDEDV